MRPLDPRLLKRASATRGFLLMAVAVGFGQALLIIAQAWLLADSVNTVFFERRPASEITGNLVLLVGVVAVRAVLAYAVETAAFGSSARVKSQLRMAVVAKTLTVGPGTLDRARTAELAQLTGRGIDSLDAYFSRYLPQLVLAVIVPLAVGLTVLTQDVLAAVILAVTLPLIPVFMVLIGLYTSSQVNRQWRTLSVLSGYFLDLVAGLPTLRVFGRAKAQARQLQEVGDRYRSATMRVLRVSFMSALALELLSTLSVAIVAVSIGLRLVDGTMVFATALFVLILAPEAYLPVRQVGVHFHAAAEGLGAADRLLSWLDEPAEEQHGDPAPDAAGATIALLDVTAGYPGAQVLDGFSARFRPGEITALVGPSGGGKSTVMHLLLRFLTADSGRLLLEPKDGPADGVDLAAVDPRSWRQQVAWVPQQPALLPGTVADNIRLGRPGATDAEVAVAAAGAGLAEQELPDGLQTAIGEGGSGVSAGQRRRIAVARALLRQSPVVLLDEPTAALDSRTELALLDTLGQLRDDGRTVVVVAHRPALVAVADTVVEVPLLTPAPEPHQVEPAPLPGMPR